MIDESNRIFFPRLCRGGGYPKKKDGSNYGYAYYREYIRSDCQRRCVYCDLHENELGGGEAMQIDHFRPEALFGALVNEPLNLHYGCARCNLLKSKHWPAGQGVHCHDGGVGFIDPFSEDRAYYFKVGDDGTLTALHPPATYLIGLMHLRREHLRKLRLRRLLLAKFREMIARVKAQALADVEAGRRTDPRYLLELCDILERLEENFSMSY